MPSYKFVPATMGNLRRYGCRQLLVYCTSGWCYHSATLNADWLADDVPVRALCRRMVCTACGLIGADVRPDWPHNPYGDSNPIWLARPIANRPLAHASVRGFNS